jgi:hypothetical protein
MEYLVEWKIEVEAESLIEAGFEARDIQLDQDSTATHFKVTAPDGECVSFDVFKARNASKVETFAEIKWTAEDVMTLAPRMTEEEAKEWLANNESHIQDRTVELGWSVIEDLLSMDGVDMSEVEELT